MPQHGLALQAMKSETIQELNTILQNQSLCPTDKYGAPMVRFSFIQTYSKHVFDRVEQTTQQEIGWFAGAYARNFRGLCPPLAPKNLIF